MSANETPSLHFIHQIIEDDNRSGKHGGRVCTRFPPEPNGYLHIGHAKSICLNFGTAQKYAGQCNLRFDDTNPCKEEQEYVDSIQEDVRWLGFDWGEGLYFASDYFDQLYAWAVQLVQKGKAYVCDLTADEVRLTRGTLTKPGKNSPFRDRSVEENLDLFERMKAGEFPDGARTLRAKIDMASPNLNLRDPVMYRILRAHHHRTGDKWCIYATYDWAHGQSDSIERITHSICTLEFENHRPLYDWYIQELGIYAPQQIEFARLNLTYTVMSKRKLLELVRDKHVAAWDDPRMPTISGFRRRGYTPEAIRAFCERVGVSKYSGVIDMSWLEDALREELNKRAPRALAVLRPLKVVIENYPEGKTEELDAVNNPEDPGAGTRKLPFSRELYIERDDFREDPPKQYFRLAPGREVRFRWAYFLKCTGVVKDAKTGEVTELRCTYDPATKGGNAPDGRKVKGTIHWVSVPHALEAEVRLYDHLFSQPYPEDVPEGANYLDKLNPKSLEVVRGYLEPSLKNATPGSRYQFERLGYFCADRKDSKPGQPVFNRSVTLADTWAKIEKKEKK
ncbi:MAG: glutamine--tRNA ligase/YqeY domain fusion protein [Gemmataceae bacterium]|nr:glutamine--tRNA ligase/YqeY domain fusion protein [Gemmataceae bacterium]